MAATADVTPPPFARIAIIGFGLIGASLALAIRRLWPSVLIIAVDRRDVIESAMRMHAADVGGDDPVMAAEADLVVLAAPVLANVALVGQLADYVPGEAIVTDVGSTKRDIVVGIVRPAVAPCIRRRAPACRCCGRRASGGQGRSVPRTPLDPDAAQQRGRGRCHAPGGADRGDRRARPDHDA